MAPKGYRGGRIKREDAHRQPDVPVQDMPVEHEEIIQAQNRAYPIMQKYLKQATTGLQSGNHDREQVWALWCTGHGVTAICERLGLGITCVNDHIRRYRDELEQGLAAIPVIAGAELIFHYQNIYHEAIAAWHKSKERRSRNQLRTVERTATGEEGTTTTNETNSQLSQEDQRGDPRFLERAQVALDRIAVLQGMVPTGSLHQARQVQAQETGSQTMQRAQIYLPHNERDEPDGEIIEMPAEEPLTVTN